MDVEVERRVLMSQDNKMLVRRAVEEVWNQGNYDALREFVSSDIVIHLPAGSNEIHGPEGIQQFFEATRAGFPDLHFTIEDQLAEGDRVATRWSARATHTGEFEGMPPTGKQVTLSGTDIDRIANGKVVECWSYSDDLGLMQQLGAIPTPEMVGR
jgi:steroid delta-isomerase-like uncharacterized protein